MHILRKTIRNEKGIRLQDTELTGMSPVDAMAPGQRSELFRAQDEPETSMLSFDFPPGVDVQVDTDQGGGGKDGLLTGQGSDEIFEVGVVSYE